MRRSFPYFNKVEFHVIYFSKLENGIDWISLWTMRLITILYFMKCGFMALSEPHTLIFNSTG